MPFDPILTDEEVTTTSPSKKEFEAELMGGCVTIGLVSIITYFVTIWPFARFPEYTWTGLATVFGVGALPACCFGVYVCRRFALAGAIGFFGGAMAAAVFMHLRLQQTMLGYYGKDIPRPEYPESFAVLIPLAWFVLTASLSFIFYRREPVEP